MSLKIILILPVALLLLLVILVLTNTSAFNRDVDAEVSRIFGNSLPADTAVVTEADLERLPPPIQRYLRYSRVVGKPKVQFVRLRQKGQFRTKPDQAWMPFEAEQYYSVNPPGFIWHAQIRVFPLVNINVRDMFADGKGSMLGRLMSTFTVAEGSGPEFNQGTMLRFLSEMIWFPTAWLSDYLSWEPIDSSSAKVTMHYQDVRASAIVQVNEAGQYVNFVADRYMAIGDTVSLEKWSAPTEGYGEFNGLKIPTKGPAIWHLKSGDFPYVRVEIVSVEYLYGGK